MILWWGIMILLMGMQHVTTQNNQNGNAAYHPKQTALLQQSQHGRIMAPPVDNNNRALPTSNANTTANTSTLIALPIATPWSSSPQLVWLLSFPNSGTSFTLRTVHRACDCATASNYAQDTLLHHHHGRTQTNTSRDLIRPVFQGLDHTGPFLRTHHNNPAEIRIPPLVLTKTHCQPPPDKKASIRNNKGNVCNTTAVDKSQVMAFFQACATGDKFKHHPSAGSTTVPQRHWLEKVHYYHNVSLLRRIRKTVHLIRHPLDNLVSRFHLFVQNYNRKHASSSSYNQTFAQYCTDMNSNQVAKQQQQQWDQPCPPKGGNQTHFSLQEVPCFSDLIKYVTWHNRAFAMTSSKFWSMPTFVLRYEDYSGGVEKFQKTQHTLLQWLEIPPSWTNDNDQPRRRVATFEEGKTYHHFYTRRQRQAMRFWTQRWATPETWQYLKDYDFDL